jgi:aminoglycoside phosphotransferase (APT) family kinase protein
MRAHGDLIASGRDADIFECGSEQVLRRSRNGRSMAGEAQTMEFVRSRGYPVPKVSEVSDDGLDLVMERVDGPTMVDAMTARPWRIGRMARQLADLHVAVHELPAPSWLKPAPCGEGDRLLHMDLHPLNVLMAPSGPVVIDWTNASRGDPWVDVAVTWALVVAGEVPAGRLEAVVTGIGRRVLVRAFLKPFAGERLRSTLAEVVPWKCKDPNMSDLEQASMWALLGRQSA